MFNMRHKQRQPQSTRSRPVTRSFSKLNVKDDNNLNSNQSESFNLEEFEKDSNIDMPQDFEDNFISQMDVQESSYQKGLANNDRSDSPTVLTNEDKEHDIFCYPSCNQGRSYSGDMLQCSICMALFHANCTDAASMSVRWNCVTCRTIPETLQTLTSQVSELHEIFSHFIDKQNQMYEAISTMSTLNDNLKNKVNQLKSENLKLRLRMYNHLPSTSSDSSDTDTDCSSSDADTESGSYTSDNHDVQVVSDHNSSLNVHHSSSQNVHHSSSPYVHASPISSTKRNMKKYHKRRKRHVSTPNVPEVDTPQVSSPVVPDVDVPLSASPHKQSLHMTSSRSIHKSNLSKKPKVTLFGDSMIRNVGDTLSKNLPHMETIVLSHSGLRIHQATKQAQNIFQNHTNKDLIVLQVGANDLTCCDGEDITNKYNTLIDAIKSCTNDSKILILAIPHRITHGCSLLNDKADYVNSRLKQRCAKDKLLCYVDANPEPVNSNYRGDGMHFNYTGRLFFSRFITKYIAHSSNFQIYRLTKHL